MMKNHKSGKNKKRPVPGSKPSGRLSKRKGIQSGGNTVEKGYIVNQKRTK